MAPESGRGLEVGVLEARIFCGRGLSGGIYAWAWTVVGGPSVGGARPPRSCWEAGGLLPESWDLSWESLGRP